MVGIDAADPVLRRALDGHGVHWDPIEVRLRGERWRFGGNGMAAVARQRLLSLLQQRAAEAGVDLRFSAPVRPDDLLDAGYDLVIAADGANSQMRARFAGAFGPSVVTATAKFIWFGTPVQHHRGPGRPRARRGPGRRRPVHERGPVPPGGHPGERRPGGRRGGAAAGRPGLDEVLETARRFYPDSLAEQGAARPG